MTCSPPEHTTTPPHIPVPTHRCLSLFDSCCDFFLPSHLLYTSHSSSPPPPCSLIFTLQPPVVPAVCSSAAAEGVLVAIGSQVHVFDGRCSALLTPSLNFETNAAERLSWSACGTFVAIATSNGVIHLLDVTTKKVFFSQTLFTNRKLRISAT